MIAGVDVSSRSIDVVLLNDDSDAAEWRRFCIAVKGGTAFDAARLVRDNLPSRSWWRDEGVWLIGLEDPFSRNQGTAKALGLVTGALLACIPPMLTIVRTPPHEWKRVLTGDSKASKDQIAMHARMLSGAFNDKNYWTQDAFDAYGIAWATRKMNAEAIRRAS